MNKPNAARLATDLHEGDHFFLHGIERRVAVRVATCDLFGADGVDLTVIDPDGHRTVLSFDDKDVVGVYDPTASG